MRPLFTLRIPAPGAWAMVLALCLVMTLAGCAVSGPKGPYPPPENLRLAETKRQEFVASFLQGRWCEAQDLLAQSVEDFLRRDDPCAAAYGHLTLWRLKAYVGVEDETARREALRLRAVGLGCPDSQQLAALDGDDFLPARDRRYRDMLAVDDPEALLDALAAEPDALYASVYARKAASQALAADRPDQARPFLELARSLDGDRGWVVFLREDWRLEALAAANTEDRNSIAQRIAILDALVDTCP